MPHRIHQIHSHQPVQTLPVKQKQHTKINFGDILTSAKQIKISKHAEQRLRERGITIEDNQWQMIEEKMDEAKNKGVQDSLVILDDAALLVSAKNNTVITALNRDEAANRIFTNINGTILINE